MVYNIRTRILIINVFSFKDLKEHVRTFYTHEQEKYDCVIPSVQENKEISKSTEPELCKTSYVEIGT